MTKSKYAFLIVSGLIIPFASQFAVANADVAATTVSPDLVKLVSGSGKVVFLKNEFVPATSLATDFGPAWMAMSDVIYQGSLRFVNHGDASIDLGQLSCDVRYRNDREDWTFQQPLVGNEVREGELITGIDASIQAGQTVAWEIPDEFIGEPTSYSDTLLDGSILRGIHLLFPRDAGALMSIDCSQTIPAGSSQSPMTVRDFEQATGGLMTLQTP